MNGLNIKKHYKLQENKYRIKTMICVYSSLSPESSEQDCLGRSSGLLYFKRPSRHDISEQWRGLSKVYPVRDLKELTATGIAPEFPDSYRDYRIPY